MKQEHKSLFSKTNVLWNNMGLNRPSTIGGIMGIIISLTPESSEDFKDKYYKSGQKFYDEVQMASTNGEVFEFLNDPCRMINIMDIYQLAEYKSSKEVQVLLKELKQHGRPKKFIESLSELFYNEIVKENLIKGDIDFQLSDAIDFVEHRIFNETFKGTKSENAVDKTFKDMGYTVKHATDEEDRKYAVDLFCSKNNILKFGVQVKPITYEMMNKEKFSKMDNDHHTLNEKKNNLMLQELGCECIYAYTTRGRIVFKDTDKIKLKNI